MITKIVSRNIKKLVPLLNDKVQTGKITLFEVFDSDNDLILSLEPNQNAYMRASDLVEVLSISDSDPYFFFSMNYDKIGFIKITEDEKKLGDD